MNVLVTPSFNAAGCTPVSKIILAVPINAAPRDISSFPSNTRKREPTLRRNLHRLPPPQTHKHRPIRQRIHHDGDEGRPGPSEGGTGVEIGFWGRDDASAGEEDGGEAGGEEGGGGWCEEGHAGADLGWGLVEGGGGGRRGTDFGGRVGHCSDDLTLVSCPLLEL